MSCKNQVWLLVALGIAVVLFAAALVIRFHLRRKSANEQHQPDPHAIEAPPHGATDQVRKN